METKIVKIGNKVIGGGNPILIQSMTNTKTENVADTVAQINALTDLGCDIIRCAGVGGCLQGLAGKRAITEQNDPSRQRCCGGSI